MTAAWDSKAFTPGRKDMPVLIAALAGEAEDHARAAARALLRNHEAALPQVLAALGGAVRPQRGRLARVLGELLRVATDGEAARAALIALMSDADMKTAAHAINAVGELGWSAAAEAALVALWTPALRREHRRAVVKALGKAGGASGRALLQSMPVPEDPEEARLLAKASLIANREHVRPEGSSVLADQALPAKVAVLAYCRAGLERMVADELGAGTLGKGLVRVTSEAPLASYFRARTMERMAIALSPGTVETVPQRIAAPSTVALLQHLTKGPLRYRLDWPGARDPDIWAAVSKIAALNPALINDPTASTWEIGVDPQTFALELRPRLDDPRFGYRTGAVFAASHPTIAAALVRMGGVVASDIVWDPFCGGATELIERALAGPFAALYGSDTDPAARPIAVANASRAGLADEAIHLSVQSCLEFRAVRPTLILSNPPMGRRVHRDGSLPALFDQLCEHIAEILAPGGRIVWASPFPERTLARMTHFGLHATRRQIVDMGGFPAEFQRFDKPSSRQYR